MSISTIWSRWGTSATAFGELRLRNFGTLPLLNVMRVREFLALANTVLDGGSAIYSSGDLFVVALEIARSFFGAVPTEFAQEHLWH